MQGVKKQIGDNAAKQPLSISQPYGLFAESIMACLSANGALHKVLSSIDKRKLQKHRWKQSLSIFGPSDEH